MATSVSEAGLGSCSAPYPVWKDQHGRAAGVSAQFVHPTRRIADDAVLLEYLPRYAKL